MDFKVDVVEFLETMHVKNISPRGSEVMFSCPFPGHKHGDRSPSASMNIRNTAWMCFGCGRRGNAVTFLSEMEDCTTFAARKWLREYFGGGFREPISTLTAEINDLFANKVTDEEHEIVNPELNEEIFHDYLMNWHMVAEDPTASAKVNGITYLLDRGFSSTTLMNYEVGYDSLDERIVLVVRDINDKFIGIKGRATRSEQQPRYRVYGRPRIPAAPYSTGDVVYLACNVEDIGGDIIVCEGELNALKMREYGYGNAVGISGAAFTSGHANIISRIGGRAILYFDSDGAGIAGASAAANMLVSRMPVLTVPKHDKDPADSTKEEVDELLSNARTILDPLNTALTTQGEPIS